MPRFRDLVGIRSGRLLVESLNGKVGGKYRWNVICDCGKRNVVTSYSLCGKRATKSCGCFQRESAAAAQFIHGMKGTIELSMLDGAKRRARAKKNGL